MSIDKLLKTLSMAVGVSGFEKEIRLLIRDLIADHVDEWRVDTLGNLIALKKGTGESNLRIMVDAHMDEVGLMITGIDRDGTCKFDTIGGFDDRAIVGKVVQVGPRKITGVIGAKPIHRISRTQIESIIKKESMRIDIGAKDKGGAARKVNVGDPVAFLTKYKRNENIVIGKAFDNRAGCAALIKLIEGERFPFDLIATFTVQEEVGIRGAQVAAYGINPDIALVLESTPAYDLPNKLDVSPNVTLGQGASIYVMDAGTVQDPRLVAHLTNTASTNNIPYQLRQPGGGGTNTSAIQRAGAGIPAATIATPTRYVHSPLSMIHLNDLKNVVALADATLRSLTPQIIGRDNGRLN